VLHPRFSPALACAFCLIHLAALAVAVVEPLPLLFKEALGTSVVLSGVSVIRRHLLFLGSSIAALTLAPDGTFLLRLAKSEIEKGAVVAGGVCASNADRAGVPIVAETLARVAAYCGQRRSGGISPLAGEAAGVS